MKYRTFGQTGLKVSEIGIGAFPISGVQQQADGTRTGWTGTDEQQSIALIHRAEELGVNLIDSAESYGAGHSEEVVGQALQGRRDKWIIATKVSPNSGLNANDPDLPTQAKKRIVEAVEGSLKRLDTDYIDIYQLHAIPLEGAMPAVMEVLAKLRMRASSVGTVFRPMIGRRLINCGGWARFTCCRLVTTCLSARQPICFILLSKRVSAHSSVFHWRRAC